ncbi:hypothetical protein Sjap_014542 [Stephania japonica]|uniref:Protein kinase domain-containing protein n=1 Tax=Stephania japonica TaxID=461633 RepID=A0AAP0IHV9_9MAGN
MALCFEAMKKKLSSKRNDFFLENNRLLLKELVSSFHGKSNTIQNFSEEEILEATNNYGSDQFLGYISVHTWYKGRCGNRDVLIKKFLDWPDRKHCATEIAVLSQIKHKNVVELLGCCLETEFPILVFKNSFNETLSHRIHRGSTSTCLEDPAFSWEEKLRIATEIAHAVTYLHSFTVTPIIHNGITAENIILDGVGGAKLANFCFAFHCLSVKLMPKHRFSWGLIVEGVEIYGHTGTRPCKGPRSGLTERAEKSNNN